MGDLTKDFSLSDFVCKDGMPVPEACHEQARLLATSLQILRDHVGKCIFINSAYRTPKHNRVVGGVENSIHLSGGAADIYVDGMTSEELFQRIDALIGEGRMQEGGLGLYDAFVHYDVRGRRARW